MYNIKGPTCCAPGIFRCETSFPWHVYLSQLWCVVAQTGISKPASRIAHPACRPLHINNHPSIYTRAATGSALGCHCPRFWSLFTWLSLFVSTWGDESLSLLHISAPHLSIVETHPTPVRGARARRWIALKSIQIQKHTDWRYERHLSCKPNLGS